LGSSYSLLIFVVFVNVIMFVHQTAVTEIDGSGTVFYNKENTFLENQNINQIDTQNTINDLPSGESTVSPTTGNFYTDIFTSIKSWFSQLDKLKYIYTMLATPYLELNRLGLPGAFVFAIGTLWYTITLFAIVTFFWRVE